jgi:hypothetical protein
MRNRTTPASTRDTASRNTGRAQPGDLIGIENDGKRTRLGDTAEDEDEALEDAEEEFRDNEEDRDD